MVNAEVQKTGNESPLAVIRKFSRRVQGTGLIQLTRKRRYYERAKSRTVSKKRALKRIQKRKDFQRLVKEGKAVEPTRRGHGHNRPQTASQASTAPREAVPAAPARFGEDTPIAR
jgi:ribosomal protein S21